MWAVLDGRAALRAGIRASSRDYIAHRRHRPIVAPVTRSPDVLVHAECRHAAEAVLVVDACKLPMLNFEDLAYLPLFREQSTWSRCSILVGVTP